MHGFFGSPGTYSFPATTRLKSQPPVLRLIAKWRLIDWPRRMHCFAKWKSSVHLSLREVSSLSDRTISIGAFAGGKTRDRVIITPLPPVSFLRTPLSVRDLMDKSCDLYAEKSNFDRRSIINIRHLRNIREKKKLASTANAKS